MELTNPNKHKSNTICNWKRSGLIYHNFDELYDPIIDEGRPNERSASWSIKNHHKKSLKLYNNLLDVGVCREQARGVLPQNLYTEYYGTTNLNNLLKFISLRSQTV